MRPPRQQFVATDPRARFLNADESIARARFARLVLDDRWELQWRRARRVVLFAKTRDPRRQSSSSAMLRNLRIELEEPSVSTGFHCKPTRALQTESARTSHRTRFGAQSATEHAHAGRV